MRRPRTGTEQASIHEQPIATSNSFYAFGFVCQQVVRVDKQLSDFLQNKQEIAALSELQEELHSYIYKKLLLLVLNQIRQYLVSKTIFHSQGRSILSNRM